MLECKCSRADYFHTKRFNVRKVSVAAGLTFYLKYFFLPLCYFVNRLIEDVRGNRGSDTQNEASRWELNPGPLQQGQSLCIHTPALPTELTEVTYVMTSGHFVSLITKTVYFGSNQASKY